MTNSIVEMLTEYGITEDQLQTDREAIAHNMDAEEFIAHMWGVEVPDEPSDEFYEKADEFIAQAGIKGMKWGRRRPRGKDGRVIKGAPAKVNPTKLAKKTVAKAAKKEEPKDKPEAAPKAKSEGLRIPSKNKMSDAELNAAINRIRLEQQYAQLTAVPKPALRKEIETIAANALRQNAQQYATKYLGVGVEMLIEAGKKQAAAGRK